MNPTEPTSNRPKQRRSGRRPSPEKRAQILDGARLVFGRTGFSTATIESISKASGVSTRTIYKHFPGKKELFAATLEVSAARIADRFEEKVEAQSAKPPNLESDLRALGMTLARQREYEPEHWAMTRQLERERERFDPEILATWRRSGPDRVHAAIRRRLLQFEESGDLRLSDPDRAATQFAVLVVADRIGTPGFPRARMSKAETTKMVNAGVEVFLHGCGQAAAPPPGGATR